MNIKVLVIVLLIVLVVCAIVAFLIYLKKSKEKASEHMSTSNESLIKVICVFGITVIVWVVAYCIVLLLRNEEIEEPSPTPSATIQPTNKPTVTPEPTNELTLTPEPTLAITVEPTEELKPTIILEPTATPEPTSEPTVTPKPTKVPKPTTTPEPTKVVTPEPTVTSEPTKIPEPTATPKPTKAPEPTATPKPTKVPSPTVTPEPTSEPTVTPKPTKVPKPTTTPEPTKTPVKDTGPLPEDKLVEESMHVSMHEYTREELPGQFTSEEELVDWLMDRQYKIYMKPVIVDKYGYDLVGEKKLINRIKYSDWDSFWFEYTFTKGDTKVIAIIGLQGAQYIDSLNAEEFIVVISLEFQNLGKTRYKYDGSVYAWPKEGFEIFFKNFG